MSCGFLIQAPMEPVNRSGGGNAVPGKAAAQQRWGTLKSQRRPGCVCTSPLPWTHVSPREERFHYTPMGALQPALILRREGDAARRTTEVTVSHNTPENQAAITFSRLFLQVYFNLSLLEIPGNTSRPKKLLFPDCL